MTGTWPRFAVSVVTSQPLKRLDELIRLGWRRFEVGMFQGPEELAEFRRCRDRFGLAFGVHHPLRMDLSKDKNCNVCNPDASKRKRGLEDLHKTLEASREIGAEYVVAHAPEARAIWNDERIPSEEEIRDLAAAGGQELADLSAACGIPVYLEQAVPHPYFTRGLDFTRIVEGHPELGLCADLQRLGLMEWGQGTDPMQFIKQTAPFIRSVHLNTREPMNRAGRPPDFPALSSLSDRRQYRQAWSEWIRVHKKAPVHPDQDPEAGWLDVVALVEAILRVNREVTLVHEYYYRVYPTEYFLEGHAWFARLVSSMCHVQEPGSDGRITVDRPVTDRRFCRVGRGGKGSRNPG